MFEIRSERDGQVTLVGRLDAAEAERATQVFRSLSGHVVVDCAGLDYVSSAGIAVFMETYKRLLSGGHSLRLVNLTPRVRNVFTYAGLDKLLGIQ
jgi:anti-anti-sigma factor